MKSRSATTEQPNDLVPFDRALDRPKPFLGVINLDSERSELDAIPVDMERFLAFSYELAEDMADLVAEYRHDSVTNLQTVCWNQRLPMDSLLDY
ncbi:MAG: hypothetical protein R3C03_11075 [Pirellulaceae bacterium]